MNEYFYRLILTFVLLIGIAALQLNMYIKKKKRDQSYKIPIKERLIYGFFIVLSASLFIWYLLDLPNALADKTEKYKGNCEIVLFVRLKDGHIEVNFANHTITFPNSDLNVKEGKYYCELDYYPKTEIGKSIKLLQKAEN